MWISAVFRECNYRWVNTECMWRCTVHTDGGTRTATERMRCSMILQYLFKSRSWRHFYAVIRERLAENCRGRTTTIICTRTNAPKYILESHRLHFGRICDQNGRNFEPCPKHTAKATKEFLKGKKWTVMQWPSQSPDLNPIEHAFHLLKTKLKGKCPKNKQELKTVAVEAWQSITRDETQRLVMSMRSRLQAVIDCKGFATKY